VGVGFGFGRGGDVAGVGVGWSDGSAVGDGDGEELTEGEIDAVGRAVGDTGTSGFEPEQPEVASIATMPAEASARRTSIHTQ